jgi:hypothetical protein
MLFPKVKSVKAIEKYKLHIQFNDGVEGVYDLAHLADRGVFTAWETDDNFKKVFINPESGAITWTGGLDIDTVSVYCNIKGIDVDKFLNSRQRHPAYL